MGWIKTQPPPSNQGETPAMRDAWDKKLQAQQAEREREAEAS